MSTAVALGLIDEDTLAATEPAAGQDPDQPDAPTQVAGQTGGVTTAVSENIADLSEAQILEQVGDNPARAAVALEAEMAGRRRKGVRSALEKIIAAPGGPEDKDV